MAEKAIPNLAAAARIARRVELRDVCIQEMSAKRHGVAKESLSPELSDRYELKKEDSKLEILCHHHLKATSAGDEVAEITVLLKLIYEIGATAEPINEADLPIFADANGAYHSWPFVREIYHSLTSRMGLPPFVLPVLRLINVVPTKTPETSVEKKPE